MRAIQRNNACPTCKTQLDQLICVPDSNSSFSAFTIWGDSCGPNFQLDQKSQMFFPKDFYRSQVEPMWLHKCKICSVVKRDMKSLRAHVSADHNLQICLLCTENRNCFPSEYQYYKQHEYETHLRNGDGDGTLGHPYCEFCQRRFYDRTALFVHLTQDHYSCHICSKAGIQYRYYSDYNALENHFRNAHYLCEERSCLERRFMVFSNSIDLSAHMLQWHPTLQVAQLPHLLH